ncbi:MAG: ubiquitin-like domain-containing protein [Candidatus Saccharimonadales bacterium]|jgi:uncharacterized protein YabE (DUF348 family)
MSVAKEKIIHRAHQVKHHPMGLPVVLFVILAVCAVAAVYLALRGGTPQLALRPNDSYIARLNIDGQIKTIPTRAKTVGDFIAREKIPVGPRDRVEPAATETIVGDNFRINVYRAEPVTVIDGAKRVQAVTAAGSPRNAVTQTGLVLYNEDRVSAAPTSNFVTEGSLGERLTIDRATAIQLDLYGTLHDVHTRSKTVAELLKRRGVVLGKDDTVQPAAETTLTPGVKVAVIRNGIQVITVEEDVAPPTKTVVDASLSFGTQAVRQEGSAGRASRTYEINNQNGKEVSRRLLQSVTIKEPVERIVAKGNTTYIPSDKMSVMAAAGISPDDYAYVDYVFSRESHWNAAAMNAGGCGGLGQACPAGKLAAVCPGWQSDPVCQTRFFTGYAVGRYGSWAGAYNAWLSKHWW